ncbi:hypothetical protein NQK81_04755 [Amycolatopsis roodepoortensis]|uniref:hypothetical protein n=1 Tax=Amycolatopsis roodepoortensis TaxID=700274 RepID=UPI00214BDABC|nr:hypothetical protein [Amycolatopsis roodepoortensis]UUV32772.1 hypothetical protein NQK81_04755 [Amycolatopsis roodepoortensis]
MKSARTALIATGCAAALLLSACGEEAGGKTVRADGTMAPGSELKVGERAVVPFSDAGKSGTIAITVKSVEIGPKEDLADFKNKGEGILPVYVRMVVENVGGTDLADTSVSVRAVNPDGKGTKVLMANATSACKGEDAPESFTTGGATYETCKTQGVKDGDEVGGVTFGDGEYQDDPITWKK